MAKVQLNPALNHISGKIDGYVHRRYRGRNFLQRRPVFTQPWSEGQQQQRATFAGGSQFAATIGADPALREFYRECGRRFELNYRQMALRDYFNPPEVHGLERGSEATGGPDTLIVRAYDAVAVVRVSIVIRDPAGATVCSGDAALRNEAWHFPLPALPADPVAPLTVVVTAYDRPGNRAEKSFPLPS
jgi:hypothetical protein